MRYDEMISRVSKYTKLCVKNETGGESYFNKLDQYIKNDIELVTSYIDFIVNQTKCKNIIMSGELAEKVIGYKQKHKMAFANGVSLYKVQGGLRYGAEISYPEEFSFIFANKEFVFLDDSYYSGNTYKAVKNFINKVGGKVIAAYVFYDGSRDGIINSLYRYYDNKQIEKGVKEVEPKEMMKKQTVNSAKVIATDVMIGDDNTLCLSNEIMSALDVKSGDYLKLEIVTDVDTKDKCIVVSKSKQKDIFDKKVAEAINWLNEIDSCKYSIGQLEKMIEGIKEIEKSLATIMRG